MPIVNAYGKRINFPDDMSHEEIANVISANEKDLNPDYKAPESGGARNFIENNILGFSTRDKPSIADQAEASADEGANTAAPQVKGAPVRQSFYNKALLDNSIGVPVTERFRKPDREGVMARIRKAADEDIKGQVQQHELEGLRTDENVPEGGFVASAKTMTGQTIKGAGQLGADYFGADKDNALIKYGDEILRENPTIVKSLSDIKDRPFMAFKEASGNMVPSFGAMLGTAALGQGIISVAPLTGPLAPVVAAVGAGVKWLGPAAIAALPSYGGIRDKQIFNDKANEDSEKAKAVALLGAATVGTIEVAFGPQNWAISMLTKEGRAALARKFAATTPMEAFVKGTLLGGVSEGSEELAQNPIEQLSSFDNPLEKKNLQDTAFGGAMGFIGGALPGGITNTAGHISQQAQIKADRINAERAKLGLDKIVKSTTVDEAINAANESVSQKPVDKNDVLRSVDPNLADIERLTGLKPSESLEIAQNELDKQSQAQQENNATQSDLEGKNNRQQKTPRDTEIVLPDNKALPAQWDIVDADNVKASLKNGESQPRDRTRSASDLQIQSIAKNPDYRRLSDSPVMDIGAPVLSNDGHIVGGNGRFEALSRAYDQDTAQEYLDNLRQDAIKKGIDPAVIDQMKKPVLVRRITQPFDTRQLAIASNSGTSAQYSDLEQARIDSERLAGLEDILTTDNGDIALTADNIRKVRDSLGNYSPAEIAPFVDANGQLSQQGMKRIRNAMLAKAYGDNPVIQGLIESNDSDIRNILGALTRVVGDAVKAQSNAPKESDITPSLLEAVNIYRQLKQKNQPVSNYLQQQDAFSDKVSPAVENILMFLDKNARSQPKLTEFFRDAYTKLGSIDSKTADIFGQEVKPKPEDLFAKPTIESQLEKHLKKNGYEFDVNPVTEREFNALSESKKAQKELAEKQAKIFRKKVVFVKTKGKFGINGVMVPAIKDTIFIDLNTPKPFHAVMAHELSHWMEQENPAAYKDMLKALKDIIVNEDGYRKKYNITDQTKGLIPREIAGDLMGDNFTKPEFWDKVAKHNPSKFQEIAKAIIKWLKNIVLKAKSRGMGSEEWVTDAKKAQDIIAKAVSQYTKEQDAKGGDVKFHRAFHGSPHDHNKFDSANIGTGEGAQAYGYGHYFADSKEVAEYYKDQLSGKKYIEKSTGKIFDSRDIPIDRMKNINSDFELYKGKLYEVELAPKQDEYLLWDKPLSEQSEKVKNALEGNIPDHKIVAGQLSVNGLLLEKTRGHNGLTGRDLYLLYKAKFAKDRKNIITGQTVKTADAKAASDYLHSSLGIRGIKYLDGSSRAKGEGAYNYVIFDDNDIEITAKFSKQEQELEDYRMEHKSPGREGNAPLSDLTGEGNIYPDDVYSNKAVQYYGTGNDAMDRQSFNKAKLYRGKPDAMVDIYRAVPKGVSDKINPGDWVTINKNYAKEHGESYFDGKYDILTKKVKASDIFTNGDSIHEWGYEPEDNIKLSKQEKLPDTITIDGVQRPTTNSEGKPIYPTEEGVRNFWKWFASSKVVDDQGRPMVVYHGTDADFYEFENKAMRDSGWHGEGFYFYPKKLWAKGYGKNIISAYLKIENPAIRETINATNTKNESIELNNELKRKDNDGVIAYDSDGTMADIVVFDPNQIKYAIGNNGEFSENNNDIRFSQQKPFNPNEDIPETKAREAQRRGQDKFNRFNVVKEFLAKEKGINISEAADVYKAEERYYGKVANQQEDFREKVRNPLVEKIAKAGYKLDEVEKYLLNRHAQEANAQNRKLTGKEDSTAYGISDQEAKDYLAKAPEKLAKLADEVQALTDKAQQLRLDNGIETQERVNAMKSAYQYYVPVRGDAESQQKQNQYKGTGKGFSMKYKPKRRLGHELRNESVIENIFQDYERAIMQVEKNRVGKALALMAAEIQMPELISINQPVKRKILQTQKAYGVLVKGDLVDVFQNEEAAKQNKQLLVATNKKLTLSDITIAPITDQRLIYSASPMLADNEVMVYMNGHEVRLQINDELMARAYKNMGVEALGNILSVGRAVNGWMSKAYTGYNPEFILTNIQRDFQSGIINLTGEQGILISGKAVANYPSSFASLLKYAATGESNKWIDAYRDNGGNTGAAYLPDLERLGEEVRKEYASYQGVIANLKEGDSANALRAAGRKTFNATLKYIEHLNSAGENAFRLATFKAMIESGKSVNEAASMAKNVTVNFNRKGEVGAELNALYLFFNASLQGTAATSHALFKGRHKYQAWGLAGSMMAVGYLTASMLGGFDDEDKYDEISDATKSRNLIMSYGDGYVKIPVPYGYGYFYNAGRMYAEAQRKGELGKMPYQLMALATEEFSPFNVASTEDSEFSSRKVAYGLLPTMARIPMEITNNFSSFTGRELYPEKEWYKSEPDNEKMWRGTKGSVYDISAQYLASIGVEISPETLKYMTRTATGGSGAFVDTSVSGAMLKSEGAELDTREIPFVRKFYGENTIQDARSRYGKAKEEARMAFEKFNALKQKNDIASVRSFVDDKKELLALNSYANKLSDVIKNIRDRQDAIKLSDQYTTAEKRLKIKELEKEEKKYYDMFMSHYKTIDRSKLQ